MGGKRIGRVPDSLVNGTASPPASASTGNTRRGNPFVGLENAIAYDRYESSFPVIDQDGKRPLVSTPYRSGGRRLINHFSAMKGHFADLGAGTGICTLELVSRIPGIDVLGIEMSSGMLRLAKFKFCHTNDPHLAGSAPEYGLEKYWDAFRDEARQFKERVHFLHADLLSVSNITSESLDGAVANQFMHWNDLSRIFAKLAIIIKPGGSVIWNSTSHFFNDALFPASDWGFRYNTFFAQVMENISRKTPVTDYRDLSVPEHGILSIRDISSKEGFETRHVATYLIPVDLQVFLKNHLPEFVGALVGADIDTDEREGLVREALIELISKPDLLGLALDDTNHKYDIVPIFESRKR